MLAVGIQISLLLSQGGGARIEIPRGTRTGGRANPINLLICLLFMSQEIAHEEGLLEVEKQAVRKSRRKGRSGECHRRSVSHSS